MALLLSEQFGSFATATCLVCGETLTSFEAPLHVEDHAQRGEFPPCPMSPDGAYRAPLI